MPSVNDATHLPGFLLWNNRRFNLALIRRNWVLQCWNGQYVNWRHRQGLCSPGSLDRCSLSLISFMRHEDYRFWNVNACSLVDRSVLKESYASTFSTNVYVLKVVAPPSSKLQTMHYNQEGCRFRIHRLKKHLTCLPASQEHYICRNWMFCFCKSFRNVSPTYLVPGVRSPDFELQGNEAHHSHSI